MNRLNREWLNAACGNDNFVPRFHFSGRSSVYVQSSPGNVLQHEQRLPVLMWQHAWQGSVAFLLSQPRPDTPFRICVGRVGSAASPKNSFGRSIVAK